MDFFLNLLQLPSMWFLALGVVVVVIVIKFVRSVIGTLISIIFTGIALIRVYLFLSDKF